MPEVPSKIVGWAAIVALFLSIWANTRPASPDAIVRLVPLGFAALVLLILWIDQRRSRG